MQNDFCFPLSDFDLLIVQAGVKICRGLSWHKSLYGGMIMKAIYLA